MQYMTEDGLSAVRLNIHFKLDSGTLKNVLLKYVYS